MGIFVDDMDLVFIAIGIFWMLLFLQSGLDKIFDWKGNVGWLKGHFSKSFLSGIVTPMLVFLAIVEILAGLACGAGVFQVVISGSTYWLSVGMVLTLVSLLMLFFGQRIAKDYEGAKTIAIYFGVALISILMIINK